MMTEPSKLQTVRNLPTASEMTQIVPTLRELNRQIQVLTKKVLSLEAAEKQRKQKTGRFNFFKSR